jgi:hypothetical protein
MKRGRPKEVPTELFTKPTKFTREFTDKDGSKSVWKYDDSVTGRGPISVEIIYPKGVDEKDEFDPTSSKIKKTKRMYYNEKNGKLVAYTRAKELGIIK